MLGFYQKLHLTDLEADYSLKSSNEDKNAWNYISTPTYYLIRCTNVHIRLLDTTQVQARDKIHLDSQTQGHKQQNLTATYYS